MEQLAYAPAITGEVDHGGNGHDRNGCLVLQTYIFFDHSLMPRLPYIIESVKGAALTSFSESSKYPCSHSQSATPECQETVSSNIGGASHCKATTHKPQLPNCSTAVLQHICTTYRSFSASLWNRKETKGVERAKP